MSAQTAPARGITEQVKSFNNGFSKSFLHLFDEQWFFYNVLSGIRIFPNHGRFSDVDLATSKLNVQEPAAGAAEKLEKKALPLALQLIRTPSIQPPRAGDERSPAINEEPDIACSCGTLHAPQQSIPSPSKSMGRRRPPQRTEILHKWFANARLAMIREASYRKGFRNKKWRSFGDLESMELQGFKDLGFVFEDVEGLGERKEKEPDGRIYLPETWFTQQSAPVMALQHVHCRSGEEMKEQLRFWARAVACNVWGR
ncbi:hypothetical protein KSP40_PGU015595 [Platanthera guangdongensis]|uniref:Uncharacterized protein n=1 Tax=Platanthera guangdongensis TaxID=2320717 RepID=A0ABR2MM08_9ASPA